MNDWVGWFGDAGWEIKYNFADFFVTKPNVAVRLWFDQNNILSHISKINLSPFLIQYSLEVTHQ